VQVLGINLLVCNAVCALRARALNEEKHQVGLNSLYVRHSGVHDMRGLAVAPEEAEDFRVAWKRICELVSAGYRSVWQAP